MPTTCCVVGCANRQSKDSDIKFYRFPADRRRRALEVSAVKRVNNDGQLWEPNVGHRVCRIHFVNGEKVDDPLHPSYVPSIALGRPVTCCVLGCGNKETSGKPLVKFYPFPSESEPERQASS